MQLNFKLKVCEKYHKNVRDNGIIIMSQPVILHTLLYYLYRSEYCQQGGQYGGVELDPEFSNLVHQVIIPLLHHILAQLLHAGGQDMVVVVLAYELAQL